MTGDNGPIAAAAAARGPEEGFLEILDKGRRVASRVQVPAGGLSLGRAYDNDVVLDDPYVDPYHARLTWRDGVLVAEDLGSLNGIYYGAGRDRCGRVAIGDGNLLRLGRSSLRFRGRDFSLPPTLVDRSLSSPLRILQRWWFPPAVFLLSLGDAALSTHLESVELFDGQDLASALTAVTLILCAWTSCWSFANRLVAQRWSFLAHLGVASSGSLAFTGYGLLVGLGTFALGLDAAKSALTYLGNTVLFGLMLLCHLQLVAQARLGRLLLASSGVAVLTGALFMLFTYLQDLAFDPSPRHEATLKPAHYKLVRGRPMQDFFGAAGELKEEVLAEIERKK